MSLATKSVHCGINMIDSTALHSSSLSLHISLVLFKSFVSNYYYYLCISDVMDAFKVYLWTHTARTSPGAACRSVVSNARHIPTIRPRASAAAA